MRYFDISEMYTAGMLLYRFIIRLIADDYHACHYCRRSISSYFSPRLPLQSRRFILPLAAPLPGHSSTELENFVIS